MNKLFKAGLLDLSGNYSEDKIRRVALSMDLRKTLEDKLYPGYVDRLGYCINNTFFNHFVFSDESPFKMHLGHKKVDWADQIEKGVQDVKVKLVFPLLFWTSDLSCISFRNRRFCQSALAER